MSGSTSAPAVALPVRLVVTKPFGDYQKGAEINGAAIAEVWADHRSHVVAAPARLAAEEQHETEH